MSICILPMQITPPLILSPRTTHLESICESSFIAKISFWRNAALSSKPILASAAIRLPLSSSASGLTCVRGWGEGTGCARRERGGQEVGAELWGPR